MPQLISAKKLLPFLIKSLHLETVSAPNFHCFRKHKMNDYLFLNLISFPSCLQDDFNLENVKLPHCLFKFVYSCVSKRWIVIEFRGMQACWKTYRPPKFTRAMRTWEAREKRSIFVSRDNVGDPNRQDRRILPAREQIQTHDSLYFACSWSQL